jgi:hypothetical protein
VPFAGAPSQPLLFDHIGQRGTANGPEECSLPSASSGAKKKQVRKMTRISDYFRAWNRLWVKAALATAAVAAVLLRLLAREQQCDDRRCHRAMPRPGIGRDSHGTARLHRRQPRHADRCGSAQSRQHPWAGRPGGLDWRSWHFRRHFPDWDRRSADRQPLAVMEQALTSDARRPCGGPRG